MQLKYYDKTFSSHKLSKHSLFLNRNKSLLKKSLRYTYKFASIISPGSLKDMTLISRAKVNSTKKNSLYIKQSYVLLTWMTYIRETQTKSTKKKNQNSIDSEEDTISTPSFFIHPPKKARLTFLKAPMAHKTFSQEQFVNKSYNLTISFNNVFRENSQINSVNNSLYTALYLRNTYLPTETNLLFLKKLRMSITCSDGQFMQL
jgi:hypothetical protein